MQDEKIVVLYLERNESAIKETDKKYGRYCFSIAHNILKNKFDSQECVNDTYMRTWNSIPPHNPQNLKAYIGKITRFLALNKHEKYMAQKRGAGEVDIVLDELSECITNILTPQDMTQDFVITEVINSFLANLSEQNRNIFVRRYWYMYPIKELAKDFGMSESNVKMKLLRMRADLKLMFEDEGVII